MKRFKDLDVINLAVQHEEFKVFTKENFETMYKPGSNGKKIMMDIKDLLNRKELESSGYNYWCL